MPAVASKSKLWLPNPARGTQICAGFDGSLNNDWTAIRCETRAGRSFTPRFGPDKHPTIWDPAEFNGEIPRDQVYAAVDEIFSRWDVARFYCDPEDWESEIGDWSVTHGDEHVFEWRTNRTAQMYHSIRRFENDLRNRRISNDGCPITQTHMDNARKAPKPGQMYLLQKPNEHQKIDATMASILAHEAVADVNVAGWPEPVDNRMFCLA